MLGTRVRDDRSKGKQIYIYITARDTFFPIVIYLVARSARFVSRSDSTIEPRPAERPNYRPCYYDESAWAPVPMIAASQITSDEHRSNVRASLHELTRARVERFGLNRVLILAFFSFLRKTSFRLLRFLVVTTMYSTMIVDTCINMSFLLITGIRDNGRWCERWIA